MELCCSRLMISRNLLIHSIGVSRTSRYVNFAGTITRVFLHIKKGPSLHINERAVMGMKYVQRGEIYLADLGEGVGSEQKGVRPVLIVQNNRGNKYSPTVTVLPITTKIHKSSGLPTHAIIDGKGGLKEKSATIAEQIVTIDKTRLIEHMGTLDDKFMRDNIHEGGKKWRNMILGWQKGLHLRLKRLRLSIISENISLEILLIRTLVHMFYMWVAKDS